ncbi:YheT family hydrolase [Bryobacter aggregatus]|uniref:YheT family hydrolase n=1 Tax=Bryobacter aggregatus TaxID=360054 RepID=UPI00068B3345|nr:alpha/beta fold hydrolase [Bryobacter aggregatus]
MNEFYPLFRNGDLSTIAANFWPRNLDETRFPGQRELHRTEPEVQVLALRHEPVTPPRGELIVLHGLEGSHESGYMKSMAQAALVRGFRVHRLNMRTCGGTEALAPTLYHAGLTSDLRSILQSLSAAGRGPIFLVGYSLGGNVVLKLTGELGSEARTLGVAGVVGISTPLDLMACCKRMQEPRNFIYSSKFIDRLKARYRRRAAVFPERFPLDGLDLVKSVLEFDDKFTARAFGFGDAANYYATQSAQGFLSGIAVPTLLIHSADDPLIPAWVYERAAPERNPSIQLKLTRYGGHVGFLSSSGMRFWSEECAADWVQQQISGT